MKQRKTSLEELILIIAILLTALAIVLLTAYLLRPPVVDDDIRLSSRCTLADAIIAANHDRPEGGCPAGGRGADDEAETEADTIVITQDITLGAELPVITSDIIIEGGGHTISGDNRWRIFYNDGGALTIRNLTMTKGRAEGDLIRDEDGSPKNDTANPIGGAIVNWWGTVAISDSAFSDNWAEATGGAIANGGELSIASSAFSGNSAEYIGGAVFNWWGTVAISDSAFSGNSAKYGGAVSNGGELSITSSAFIDNSAQFIGGAVSNGGALSIVSSAFSGNSADKGGAVANAAGGALSIVNSIIAGGGGNACSSDGELKQNISNFIQDGSCSPAFEGDPMLGEPVKPEDGSPAYLPLLAGSPAIDAADDDYCPETDQIGAARPQGGGCDIGAVEYVP